MFLNREFTVKVVLSILYRFKLFVTVWSLALSSSCCIW